jgi:RNA polymerase sigma-70 factor, ECF subfamily
MGIPPPHEITELLQQLRTGSRDALDRLMPLVYGELRRQAGRYLQRERRDHTLQPTALVHEAYLRLVGHHQAPWQNRAHFFGIAAQTMRRILVDHARGLQRIKRGGPQQKVALEEAHALTEDSTVDLLALDEALEQLVKLDPQAARIVELRYFAGLSVEETAEALGISPTSVKRDWRMAKAWLHAALARAPDAS